MKKVVRLTESDLVRIVKRVVNENEFYMDTNYSKPSYMNKRNDGPEYDIKAIDCDDKVQEGYADVNPDTGEIIVRYCKGNENELDYLKKYGYELAMEKYGFKDLK